MCWGCGLPSYVEKGPIWASPCVSLNQVERGQFRSRERVLIEQERQEKSEREEKRAVFGHTSSCCTKSTTATSFTVRSGWNLDSRFVTSGSSIWTVWLVRRCSRWEKSAFYSSSEIGFSGSSCSLFQVYCSIALYPCWARFVLHIETLLYLVLIIVELYYWLVPVVVYFSHWEGFSTLKILCLFVFVIFSCCHICWLLLTDSCK